MKKHETKTFKVGLVLIRLITISSRIYVKIFGKKYIQI